MPLTAKDSMGTWIDDFKKSDAPQFKGKSEKERRDMAIAARLSAMKESLDEAIDKNHPIAKEYDALKKHDIKHLRTMIKGQNKIIDTSDFKTKEHAISHYLRSKHGNKKVADVFGLKEDITEEKKGLWANIHAKRKRGEKPNPPGHPDRPTAQNFKDASKEESTDAYGKSMEREKEKRLTSNDQDKLARIRMMMDREKARKANQANRASHNAIVKGHKFAHPKPTKEEVQEGTGSLKPGWMLKKDPELAKKVKDKVDLAKKRQATYGDKSAGKSVKEVSTNTLTSYLRKASPTVDAAKERLPGIKRALNKLDQKTRKEEVDLNETPKVDQGLSGKQKVAARAERGDNSRGFNVGNTTGGTWRGKDAHSPYKDSGVAKSGERKGLLKKDAIAKTKDAIKSRLNKEEVDEGAQQALRKYVPGYAKKQIDKKMDDAKFGKTDVDKDANFWRYKKVQDKLKKEDVNIDELSNTFLQRYKKKAGEEASAADKKGDINKGNKRFSGIMKATRKQFNNDTK